MIAQSDIYLALLLGYTEENCGAVVSATHGNATKVYHALVIPVRISKEEILEFIVDPSSVVF